MLRELQAPRLRTNFVDVGGAANSHVHARVRRRGLGAMEGAVAGRDSRGDDSA